LLTHFLLSTFFFSLSLFLFCFQCAFVFSQLSVRFVTSSSIQKLLNDSTCPSKSATLSLPLLPLLPLLILFSGQVPPVLLLFCLRLPSSPTSFSLFTTFVQSRKCQSKQNVSLQYPLYPLPLPTNILAHLNTIVSLFPPQMCVRAFQLFYKNN